MADYMTQTPSIPNQPLARERQTSKKLWIRELLDGTFEQNEQGNNLLTSRGNANRVNIIGVIISKEELPVSSLTVDDGSGQVVVRSFDQKLGQRVGSVVQVVGRPRLYQGQLYIASEAIALLNTGWLAFRKKELGDVQHVVAAVETKKIVPEPTGDEGRAEKILRLIKEFDTGDGAPIEMVVLKSGVKEAEAIIEQLLLTGDIFELRAGKVKVL